MDFSKKLLNIAVIGVSSALFLTSCGTTSASENASENSDQVVEEIRDMLPEEILESNKVSVVTDPSQAPYEYVDEDDQILGINKDLADEVERILGVEFEWHRTDFAGLITGLTTKRHDMMIEAMWDTEERREEIDFVNNLVSANNIVVAEGNPAGITDLDDLCGKKVSTLEGSLMVGLLEEHQSECGSNKIDVSIAQTTADQLLWLSTGRAEATIANPIVTEFSLAEGTARNIEVVEGEGYLKNNYGWGFGKDSHELRDAVAAALQHLIDSGKYDSIMDDWNVAENSRLSEIEVNSEKVSK